MHSSKRRVDEDLDELVGIDELAHHLALGAERRDERAQDDHACVDEQLRDFADTADVLHAIGVGEAEVAIQAVADVVAVEHVSVRATRVQLTLEDAGDRALARARTAP